MARSWSLEIWIQFGKMFLKSTQQLIHMNLRYIALQLCTCTWIEIMTGVGVSLYLLYLHSYMLAIITSTVFTPLIVFHFIVARMSSSDDYYCYGQKCSRNSWPTALVINGLYSFATDSESKKENEKKDNRINPRGSKQ